MEEDSALALRMLREEAAMWKSLGSVSPFKHWLLDNGEVCGPRIKVRGLPLLAKKQCYSNSMRTLYRSAADKDEWFYTEGVVASPDLPLLIDHAWLTNRKGAVLDRTLRRKGINGEARGHSYFGIPFAFDFACMATARHGYYGLFSNGAVYNRDIVGQPVNEGRAWPKKEE